MLTPLKPFQTFTSMKKRLLLGTVALDVLVLSTAAMVWPGALQPLAAGCGLGLFYLWSLIFTAEHPRRKIQFVFSLTRMLGLAYIVVQLGHARLMDVGIVILGLLSYKVMLTVEYAVQAWPAFRKSRSQSIKSPSPGS